VVDLGFTRLKALGSRALSRCGATQVSVPASLRDIGCEAFSRTPLRILDLSACANVCVTRDQTNVLVDLSLPGRGFAAAAKAFLPGSAIAVLRADVGQVEINKLFPHLDGWGLEKLCVVSSSMGKYEWQRSGQSALVGLTDPVMVTAPASVTMTAWREMPVGWEPFLRVIDLSGLAIETLPYGASLEGLVWLDGAVLPTGLRVLPKYFFGGCWRLSSIDASRTALQKIGFGACEACRSLAVFAFPSSVREVPYAFDGTSIQVIDLTDTMAEEVSVDGMIFLVDLVLPRRCVLGMALGVPSLCRVTFGAAEDGTLFIWQPTEVRFESLTADSEFSPGLLEARVYGEVACELRRETLPFPPP
jgi:hypothetical protein